MSHHFIVIGAQRSGTTWLHDVLAEHPDIAMARPGRPEPKAFLREKPMGREDYRAAFFDHATSQHARGEKSTSYLESPHAPSRIEATLGRVQIVVQLRDPLARAVSNWKFSVQHGLEERPLNEALRGDLRHPRPWDRTRSSVSPFAYVTRGRYADQLVRWTERFDVHVQFLEELHADPSRLAALYRWLGVDENFWPSGASTRANVSRAADEPLDGRLVADLREYYAESDAALTELVGRELPWPVREPG